MIRWSLPFLRYPDTVARMPSRYARHLQPAEPDVREARVLGVLIFLLGVGLLLFA